MYIAAVKRSVGQIKAAQLDAAIAKNPGGFALNRNSFGSALSTYYGTSRGIAREILHLVFFVPRGAPRDVIKEDVRERIDTIHEMLGLAKDQALIRQGHPLLGEYEVPSAGFALRFFPMEGKGAVNIARPTPGSETDQFLEALGKTQIPEFARSYELGDSIVLISGKIEQWRLPGDPARRADRDSSGKDLSKALYFVEKNDSPAINLLRPYYLSYYEDGPLCSSPCRRSHSRCSICREDSRDQ